ncbi:autotransporter-associated beta strand repeat-containing protein, partial [Escherichia coli]
MNSGNFGGTIKDVNTGRRLALVKSTSGVLTLSGNNTFTGGTSITGGTL